MKLTQSILAGLAMLLLTTPLQAQIDFCGELPSNTASNPDPDFISADRFGNTYDIIPPGNIFPLDIDCSVGYYEIDFTDDVPETYHATICQAFADVANLIARRTNGCGEIEEEPIRIEVIASATTTAASSKYYGINHPLCNNVVMNRVYTKINGGTIPDLSSDAILYVNINPPGNGWHTDWLTDCPSNSFDLYSAVLHEIGHMLGYASKIDVDGTGTQGFHTLWSQYLHTTNEYIPNGQSQNVHPLLVSDCTSNCWNLNESTFPVIEPFFENAVANNCAASGSIDFVFGADAIAPVLGGTSNNFANILSHLNATCNSQFVDYVMQPDLFDGVERRNFTADEEAILCQLGYNISGCDGCYLVAQSESIFYNPPPLTDYDECCIKDYFTCEGTTLTIPLADLLCNDLSNDEELELDLDLFAYQEDFIDYDIIGDDLFITIDQAGFTQINYNVSGCDCKVIRSKLIIEVGICVSCDDVSPCDNLICTDGFQEFNPGNGVTELHYTLGDGYYVYFDPMDGFTQNSVDICQNASNKYLRFGGYLDHAGEGLTLKLQEPIAPGCSVNISFLASAREQAGQLEVLGSQGYPCHPLEGFVNSGCVNTDCGSFIYSPGCLGDLIEIDNINNETVACPTSIDLIPYSESYVNNLGFPIDYITIYPMGNHTVYLDDLIITKSCDPGFIYNIDCPLVQFTSNNIPDGYTHYWDFGDGTNSNQANPEHLYSNSGTFTVVHSITDDCGTISSEPVEISLNCINENCQCINGENIQGITNISAYTNESQFVNTCVSISGTLIIDKPFTFNGCSILMQPGAEIIVNPGRRLYIFSSNIGGCGVELWKSITVRNNALLGVRNSTISDGREAITLLNQSRLRLITSTMDRNYRSVYVPSDFGIPSIVHGAIYKTNFTCFGSLLHNYELEDLGATSLAGIWMNRTTGLTIGATAPWPTPPTNVNTFSNLRNGVVGINSVVTVNKSEFMDLVGESSDINSLSGIGIYTRGGILSTFKNTFENGFTGIHAEQTNIQKIDNCSFFGFQDGINVRLGQLTQNNITNNEIHCESVGIELLSMDNAEIDISGNMIYPGENAPNVGFAGISVQNSSFSEEGSALISNNNIYMNNTFRGFLINQVKNLRLIDNTIEEQSVSSITGDLYAAISLTGGVNCQIRENQITGLGLNSPLTGIRISNSTGTVFCCNAIDGTRRGVSVVGECDDTNLRATDFMNIAERGLHYNGSANTGDQFEFDVANNSFVLYGNRWIEMSGASAGSAEHEASNPDDVLLSQFMTNPNEPWNDPINPVSASSQWFTAVSSNPLNLTINCNANPDCQIPVMFGLGPIDVNDIKTAEAYNLSGTFGGGLEWEASRHLYRKLAINSFLQQQNASVDAFYQANASTSLGRLNDMEFSLKNLYQPDQVLWQNLQTQLQQIKTLLPEIADRESILFNDPDYIETPIDPVLDSLKNLLSNYYANASSILDSINQSRLSAIPALVSENSLIIATATFDGDLQAVNDVYLKTIAQGHYDFDASQLFTIETIAAKCPLEYGNAVFFARALLALNGDYIFNNDCNSEKGKRIAGREDDKNSLVLYPNPALSEVTLEFAFNLETSKHINVYNARGQLVKQVRVPINESKYLLDISGLNSGIYICEVAGIGIEKLIIFRE